MFSSIAATPSASDSTRATSAYSSSVVPQMLTMVRAPRSRSSGSFSRTKRWTPMPCRPIAFSMPAGVSAIRGGGWPWRSLRKRPLTATPPSDERSTTSSYSRPYPKQPLAAMIGLGSSSEPMRTRRSIDVQSHTMSAPSNTGPPMHERTKCCRPGGVAHRHDAAVAAAEAASHHALDRHFAALAESRGERRDGGEHRLGPARVDRRRSASARVFASARSSGTRDASRGRRGCRPRWRARASRRAARRNPDRTARRRCARRRRASSACRRARAIRPASQTARGRRRRPPSTLRSAAARVNGLPSGPRHATRVARLERIQRARVPAGALVEDADRRDAIRRRESLRRPRTAAAGSSPASAPALTITNCPGCVALADCRRRKGQHVVVARRA